MEGNDIKIMAVGILAASQLVFGCPAFLHQDAAYISLVHHFFHANVFHLAVNCLSLWSLFRGGQRYGILPLVAAYIIGSLSWFFTSADVVGFSNVIFALIGLRTPSLRHAWWRQPAVLVFLAMTALMALLPQVSAVTHIVSFVLGCIASGVQRIIQNIVRDFSRAAGH
jgi:membrane associated rhomboid family serine protease